MIQDLLGLAMFGSFLWFSVVTIALIALFFYAEYEEQGFIAFGGVVAYLIINHYWGNVPILHYITWTNIALYLGIGFLYAIARTYVYGRKLEKFDNHAVDDLKGNVFRWWFLFPISLISWAISDLVGDIWDFIYDKVGNGFQYVMKAGFNSRKVTNS